MSQPVRPAQKIGMMGGTFNPVHLGHLRAAEEIAEKLKLDQVYFIPAASPPHKQDEALADYWHRLEMLKLAVSDRPGFWASDLENHLPQPSYTINTIKAFKKTWNADAGIYFLVGLDSFMSLPKWHEYRQLLVESSFVVFGRAGIDETFDEMKKMLADYVHPTIKWNVINEIFTAPGIQSVHYLPGGQLEISSTDLRHRLETGTSVRYLVPEPVRIYIEKNGLYRPGVPS